MSYRTAILIDRYEKSFSDSELQAQVTTTVKYNASLEDGIVNLQEVTSASIGNYPGHKISNAVSTPFNVTYGGERGEQLSVSMDKQQNLTSTHKRVINGVTYVRVPYRYGTVTEYSNGKKVLVAMSSSDPAPYIWHSNLEEVVASFSWDEYFTTNDGQKLAEKPEFLKGYFIYTENQEQQDPYGEAPENDKVWPALKILTDEDFKAVYLSDDDHYYFLVEIDGTETLLGSVYEQEEPPYFGAEGILGEFLKGELLQEPIDAAIINDGEEEVVTLDMKFGDEYYRVLNTEEVVRVTEDPSGDVTEPDESSYRIMLIESYYMDAINDIKTISTFFNGPYSGLADAKSYVNEVLGENPTYPAEIVYPADFTMEEINLFKTTVETNSEVTLKGELQIIDAEGTVIA